MLVDTMSHQELTSEILNDFNAVSKSIERLVEAYDKLRRKGKVNKTSKYSKAYEIKTKKKNNWLIILSKGPEFPYKGTESIYLCNLVYYYNSKRGLRVFRVVPEGHKSYRLIVFNGHFFSRYNQRMNLKLVDPLDIVKHFFAVNPHAFGKIFLLEGKEINIGICKEGLLLGDIQEGGNWLVSKTFITVEQGRPDQIRQVLKSFETDMKKRYGLSEDFAFTQANFEYLADEIVRFL